MPVQTTQTRAVLNGNGTATVFPFGFHVADASTVAVYLTSAAGAQVQLPSSAYTVTLSSGVDGGSVALAGAAPPSGTTITIVRFLPETQLTNILNQGAFNPAVVVTALDNLEMQTQQIQDQVTRSVRAPYSDPLSQSLVLPTAKLRASQVLGFDASGAPAMYPIGSGAAVTASNVSFQSSASGSIASNINARLDHTLDFVADFGGVGDGATDNTTAWNAFITAWLATGRPAFIPAGHYMLAGPITTDLSAARTVGGTLSGAGGQRSILDITNTTTAPAWTLQATAGASFYFNLADFAVRSSCASPTLSIGRNLGVPANGKANYPDEANEWDVSKLVVNNNSTSPSAVGIAINGAYNCNFFATSNTAGYGVALYCTMLQFSDVRGSYSGSHIGIQFAEFYSYGNTFLNLDLEVVDICVQFDLAQANRNLFLGGQFVWSNGHGTPVAAIVGTAGNNNRFIGANFGSGGSVISTGSVGILVDGLNGGPLSATQLTIDTTGGSDADIVLNTDGGHSRYAILKRGGLTRWQLGADNAGETGANAGTNLVFQRFDDTGAIIDSPLYIERVNGQATIRKLECLSVGFFGAGVTDVRPVVSGSRGTMTAAAVSLMAAMVTLGLITDSTSA